MTAAHETTPTPDNEPARILLYSDDRATRDEIRTLVGRRASIDTPRIEWTETATAAAVVSRVENETFDLLILDGEAGKVGGLGLTRTLKSEVFALPPVLVTIARQQDAWLASWSEAESVVSYPLDAVVLQEAVAEQLRARTTQRS
ncbi:MULTISPECIES: response regulator transcription factor [unclassified Pseudactinotalea]|uniref:response regulator transcription factor n=1 Tax=unclassified Pseudactinotalea TaxID=2649176 RepID=UPI00128B45A6|nr:MULTISPECIES: response regulator transcription factor [unclassified Pseudactinotalea]MPV49448.1 response regulator [Pseudactinotalea sp. HY160]QGH69263.1 response regulator [Pseudactinotalea sp. HY158]